MNDTDPITRLKGHAFRAGLALDEMLDQLDDADKVPADFACLLRGFDLAQDEVENAIEFLEEFFQVRKFQEGGAA
jgi:hypothetical protein